ncbi:hypothetical protein [Mammaliicoccus lentus]|uniref:hypothetical protein n=1 Tax=Mammaliicoccus lentus TaxID=42858 RepID=UPI001B33B5EF|nr:hypothetical protein [Mammaliicoccus lentus]
MIKIRLFIKILFAGIIGGLLIVLLLNIIKLNVLKPFEKIEVIIGVTGLFTTFLGAYIGAKIAGSESRKLFKQQIKMNDLQKNMDSNIFVLEKLDSIPEHIKIIKKLLDKHDVLYANNLEKLNGTYKQILYILNEVKEKNLSKTSIVIYRDVMNFNNKVQNSKALFLYPINNTDCEKLVSNTLDVDLPEIFLCSWTSNNFNEYKEWIVTIRRDPEDLYGDENLIPIEKIIRSNKRFFNQKLKSLKDEINYLDEEYAKMTYKNTDDLISDYTKLYKD